MATSYATRALCASATALISRNAASAVASSRRFTRNGGDGEKNVNALQAALGVSHSRTSQNLAILRAHRLVTERREGATSTTGSCNQTSPNGCSRGSVFIEADLERLQQRQAAIEEARQIWQPSGDN